MRSQRAGQVDPVHQSTAQQRTQRIGVIRQDELDHL
jgi:hypothetical protein